MLKEVSFNTELEIEFYTVAKETKPAKSKHCSCCMYCEQGKGCLATPNQRIYKHLCWKAKNIYILKKEGLYGEKIKSSTSVN